MIHPGAIWVVCEGTDATHLELIGKACALAEAGAKQVAALVACGEEAAAACIQAGAAAALVLTDMPEDPCRVGDGIARVLAGYAPDVALFPATVRGRMLSAWVAAKLGTGLTADCTALSWAEDGLLLQTRPAFGGNLTADILCRTRRPQLASVRPRVFPPPMLQAGREGIILHEPCGGTPRMARETFLPVDDSCSLAEAEIIVAGGKGIGSKEGFAALRRLAALLGGARGMTHAVGATRSAVDAGYIGYAHQVGQTGVTVRPRLYIAVGISGLVQHIVGMSAAETIVAINSDRRAPIFSHANWGIVADWQDAVGEMIHRLEKERAS